MYCIKCGAALPAGALFCAKCGVKQEGEPRSAAASDEQAAKGIVPTGKGITDPEAAGERTHSVVGWFLGAVLALFALIVFVAVGASVGGPEKAGELSTANLALADNVVDPPTSLGVADTETNSVDVAPPEPAEAEASVEEDVGLELTPAQLNALRSAQQYLDMTGFSREGLIQQLSSEYGSGYSRADATAAVDSLNVDWHENAAKSARQYLEMTGFSCQKLIEQLSSDYGSKYTVEQATYGARQAGAC